LLLTSLNNAAEIQVASELKAMAMTKINAAVRECLLQIISDITADHPFSHQDDFCLASR